MNAKSVWRSMIVIILVASVAILMSACGDDDDEARPGYYPEPDDDDDIDMDDDLNDDADDDLDDDLDDDDTIPPDLIDHIVLSFDPDPYEEDSYFYSGASFGMRVDLYGADNEFLGQTDDYTINVESDPADASFQLDMDTETIIFDPTQETVYYITATLNSKDIDSDLVVVLIQIENSAKIELISPERGLFTQGGAGVTVEGTCVIENDSREEIPCPKVEINGNSIIDLTDEGHFQYEVYLVEGLNRIVVRALGELDAPLGEVNVSVLKCDNPLADGEMIESAIGARVNEEGFNSIEDIIMDMIGDIDIMEYIPDPLFEESLGDYTVSLSVTEFNYDDFQVDIGPDDYDSVLELEIHIINLSIALQGSGEFFDLLCGGENSGVLTASDLSLTAFVDIFVAETDGGLSVVIDNIDVGGLDSAEVSGFGDTCDGLLNTVLGSDVIGPVLEELLSTLIIDELQPMIEDLLNDLVLAGSFDLLDHTFNISADFDDIFLYDGGLSIWMSANFASDDVDPDVPEMPGSFRIAGTYPEMTATIPPNYLDPYGFGVVLNDDIINQALFEVFQAGVLGMDIDGLTAGEMALIFVTPQLVLPPFSADDPAILRLEPLLQPIITMESGDGLNASLAMGEYMLHVIIDTDGGEVKVFSAAITLIFPVGITIDDQGLLFIEVDPEDFDVDVTVWFEYGTMHFNAGLVEELIPNLIEGVIPMLGDILGGIAIPSFEGYTLSVDSLMAVGESHDFIGMYGSLASIEE